MNLQPGRFWPARVLFACQPTKPPRRRHVTRYLCIFVICASGKKPFFFSSDPYRSAIGTPCAKHKQHFVPWMEGSLVDRTRLTILHNTGVLAACLLRLRRSHMRLLPLQPRPRRLHSLPDPTFADFLHTHCEYNAHAASFPDVSQCYHRLCKRYSWSLGMIGNLITRQRRRA